MPNMMKAYRFYGPGDMRMDDVPIPKAGLGESVVKVKIVSMCGTDLHILKGEYPVRTPRILGYEFMGQVYELGEGVSGYSEGGTGLSFLRPHHVVSVRTVWLP